MTRQEAENFLKSIGAEPTKDAVDSYLNTVNSAIQKEKDRADKYKVEADKVADLQSKLDEISNQNLTDIQKVNKALEQANAKNANLEKQIATMQTKAKLAEMGIVGESADKLFNEEGTISLDVLGQILSETKASAAAAKEAELAGKAGNPSGASGGSDEAEDNSEGAMYAKQFSAQFTTTQNN